MKWFTRSRLHADRFADQLHLRRHQAPGARLPRRLRKQGVLVGRDFPPYEKTHCRISICTMEDMQNAVKVFGRRWLAGRGCLEAGFEVDSGPQS